MTTPSSITGSHEADLVDGLTETLFQVRVWRRSPLQASIERTCNDGRPWFALQAQVPPSPAPQVKR